MQNVSSSESPPRGVAAEFAERESTRAAEIERHVEAATYQDVSARAGARGFAQLKQRSQPGMMDFSDSDGFAIESGAEISACNYERGVEAEAQRGSGYGAFEARGAWLIAKQQISRAEGERIHWPRGRDTDLPVAEASRIVLYGCHRAAFDNFDGALPVLEGTQKTRGDAAFGERFAGDDLAQVGEVGFDAGDRGVGERVSKIA